MTKNTLRKCLLDWISSHSDGRNVGCTFHFPDGMRKHENRWDSEWHSKCFRRYLNQLDRRIFKSKAKKGNRRVGRLVVLEYSDNVGWHVHTLFGLPAAWTTDKFIELLRDLWIKFIGQFKAGIRNDRMFHGTQADAGFLSYITKWIGDGLQDGERALLDWENAYIPAD